MIHQIDKRGSDYVVHFAYRDREKIEIWETSDAPDSVDAKHIAELYLKKALEEERAKRVDMSDYAEKLSEDYSNEAMF